MTQIKISTKKKKKTRLPDIEKRVVVAKGEVEEERIGIGGLAEPNLYFFF